MNVRLGIDLGGTFIKAGIVDSSYKILYRLRHPAGPAAIAMVVPISRYPGLGGLGAGAEVGFENVFKRPRSCYTHIALEDKARAIGRLAGVGG